MKMDYKKKKKKSKVVEFGCNFILFLKLCTILTLFIFNKIGFLILKLNKFDL